MEKEDDIDDADDTVVDETAAKAESIGKDLGVEGGDGKEVIPDYDIQEAPDERIAKTRDGAIASDRNGRKELSNKEKRDAKKRKQREAFRQKDADIAQLRTENLSMQEQLSQIQGRLAGVDKGNVKSALNDTIKLFNAATEKHTQAFADGDGAKATLAMKEMYDAQKRIDQLQDLDKRLEQRPVQEQQQRPQFDASVVNHATEWAKNNPWFKKDVNGNAADEDSEIAMALSARLVKEGFDPKSEDFWDELSERAEKRMPHVIDARGEDEEDDEPIVQQPRKRAAPPVSGGANRGDIKSKVSVQVSTAFLDTLKANGLYDNPEVRNRHIHAHLQWKKNNPDAR